VKQRLRREALAVPVVAGVLLLAVDAIAASGERVIGQASGSGENAGAQAEGEARSPKALYVRGSATPAQPVTVNWYIVCNYPAFEVKDKKGVWTLQPPFKKKVPFPKKKPLKCGLSVSGSIASGDVSITLLAR
jgi:hypothetical protein